MPFPPADRCSSASGKESGDKVNQDGNEGHDERTEGNDCQERKSNQNNQQHWIDETNSIQLVCGRVDRVIGSRVLEEQSSQIKQWITVSLTL